MAKSFDKLGCLAYLCKTSNEAWYLSGILEVLQAVGGQIVILDGPEIYSECVPTRMWRTWRISLIGGDSWTGVYNAEDYPEILRKNSMPLTIKRSRMSPSGRLGLV